MSNITRERELKKYKRRKRTKKILLGSVLSLPISAASIGSFYLYLNFSKENNNEIKNIEAKIKSFLNDKMFLSSNITTKEQAEKQIIKNIKEKANIPQLLNYKLKVSSNLEQNSKNSNNVFLTIYSDFTSSKKLKVSNVIWMTKEQENKDKAFLSNIENLIKTKITTGIQINNSLTSKEQVKESIISQIKNAIRKQYLYNDQSYKIEIENIEKINQDGEKHNIFINLKKDNQEIKNIKIKNVVWEQTDEQLSNEIIEFIKNNQQNITILKDITIFESDFKKKVEEQIKTQLKNNFTKNKKKWNRIKDTVEEKTWLNTIATKNQIKLTIIIGSIQKEVTLKNVVWENIDKELQFQKVQNTLEQIIKKYNEEKITLSFNGENSSCINSERLKIYLNILNNDLFKNIEISLKEKINLNDKKESQLILQSKENWILTTNNKIQVNLKKKQFINVASNDHRSFYCSTIDKNHILIGSGIDKWLYRALVDKKGQIFSIKKIWNEDFDWGSIQQIDPTHYLVGTFREGLYLLTLNDDFTLKEEPKQIFSTDVGTGSIQQIDPTHYLVGTFREGLYLLTLNDDFTLKEEPKQIFSTDVGTGSIQQIDPTHYLVGTFRKGLYLLTLNDDFTLKEEPKKIFSTDVRCGCIQQIDPTHYLVGTSSKGLYLLTLNDDFTLKEEPKQIFSTDVEYGFIQQIDATHYLVGTSSKGLYSLTLNDDFTLKEEPKQIFSTDVECGFIQQIDPTHYLVGTYEEGLYSLTQDSKEEWIPTPYCKKPKI